MSGFLMCDEILLGKVSKARSYLLLAITHIVRLVLLVEFVSSLTQLLTLAQVIYTGQSFSWMLFCLTKHSFYRGPILVTVNM